MWEDLWRLHENTVLVYKRDFNTWILLFLGTRSNLIWFLKYKCLETLEETKIGVEKVCKIYAAFPNNLQRAKEKKKTYFKI